MKHVLSCFCSCIFQQLPAISPILSTHIDAQRLTLVPNWPKHVSSWLALIQCLWISWSPWCDLCAVLRKCWQIALTFIGRLCWCMYGAGLGNQAGVNCSADTSDSLCHGQLSSTIPLTMHCHSGGGGSIISALFITRGRHSSMEQWHIFMKTVIRHTVFEAVDYVHGGIHTSAICRSVFPLSCVLVRSWDERTQENLECTTKFLYKKVFCTYLMHIIPYTDESW